ncbi:oligoendopeptidase F [Paenibacillus vortex V453]|uniref:Oligoendopeptidase F n=1 Tax=Paenibacillus vortex V453 TaxID=715225 RepID=A0A2R9SQA1_9BACL|nr:oligoendopeptidase F [Paenibacillus vortex V453]
MRGAKVMCITLAISLIAVSTARSQALSEGTRTPNNTHHSRRISMEQLLKRADVPKEHQWKLEDMFADQKAWDASFAELKNLLKRTRRVSRQIKQRGIHQRMLRARRRNFLSCRASIRVCSHAS